MKRFLTGTDQAFADLKRQAKAAAFVQIRDAELPPGCVPARARIGIKVDPETEASVLYVDFGVRYYGSDPVAARWFREGELVFPTFDALRTWLTADLKKLFDTPIDIEAPPGEVSQEPIHSCDLRAVPAPSSPGASSPTEATQSTNETTAPSAEATDRDNLVTGRLVELVVRQLGITHGVDVRTIDAPLIALLTDRLRTAAPADDHAGLIEEVVGGALSLAAVQGHESVALMAGPPVTCTPTTLPA